MVSPPKSLFTTCKHLKGYLNVPQTTNDLCGHNINTHTPIEKALVYLKNIPNSHVLCVYLHIFYNKKLSPTPKTALTFNNGINIKYL